MFSSNLSNFPEGVSTTIIVILSVIVFLLVALIAVLIYFIIKYRESKNPVAAQIHENIKLEIIWTMVPLVIMMAMFYFGWVAWKSMEANLPADALHIEATADMWKWTFTYENGKRIDTLVIPAGKHVALDMEAVDVIHSLHIPAFCFKKDVVPGTPRTSWFIANSPGTYDLFCTEYYGLENSTTATLVKALSQNEFDIWYRANKTDKAIEKAETTVSMVDKGKKLVQQLGCNACHSTDGSKIVGPSYKGLFGKEEFVIRDGKEKKITIDDEYLRTSIIDPNKDIVQGYNKGLMLSYKDQVNDEELLQIVEYIKSIE